MMLHSLFLLSVLKISAQIKAYLPSPTPLHGYSVVYIIGSQIWGHLSCLVHLDIKSTIQYAINSCAHKCLPDCLLWTKLQNDFSSTKWCCIYSFLWS